MPGTPIPRYTVVFLADGVPPKKFVLLKRSPQKSFAPGWYTGIGGKVEPGEDASAGAVRELEEETGITGVPLTEFGRVVIHGNNPRVLYYFFAAAPNDLLPVCTEGTLEWVDLAQLWEKQVLPNTRVFLEEWHARMWGTTRPFTLFIERDDARDLNAPILSLEVREGLHHA